MSSQFAGTVVAFDEFVGLGEVRRDDGVVFPFHCIELTDGSRTIQPGVAVAFGLLCKLGRYEARAIARQ